MTRRAAIYCRISRDKEGAGLGVDRQEQDCREVAARLGWQVVAVHPDNDLSAYSGKPRPGYLALLEDLRTGTADAVLAWHTDRLHRSPVELEEYIAVCDPRGVPTQTVRAGPLDLATPSGRMVARVLGAVARHEVEHGQDRQRRARLQAATEGRWTGGRRPYGYEADGVTVVEAEAACVLDASQQVLAGASLNAITAELNRRGERTSTGRPWRQTELRRVLLRSRNAGLMQHHGQVLGKAVWPALVDEDLWRAVVGVLTDPKRRTNPGAGVRWLLSGIAMCGVCGGPVRSTSAGGHSSGRPMKPGYTCRSGKHVVRDAAECDRLVENVILERLRRPDARDLLTTGRTADTTELHQEADLVRQRLTGLADAYADGDIDAQQLRAGTERLRARLDVIESELATSTRGSVLAGVVDAPNPAEVWAKLDLGRRRAIVDTLVAVTILPGRKGRRPGWKAGESYFDPQTVRIEPRRKKS
jgi:DNA invertase Pin-like site-specific DNA recombinase